jgi:hypothetical protein
VLALPRLPLLLSLLSLLWRCRAGFNAPATRLKPLDRESRHRAQRLCIHSCTAAWLQALHRHQHKPRSLARIHLRIEFAVSLTFGDAQCVHPDIVC